MANRKLGIHIAPGALKLVELEEQAKKFQLADSSVDFFPPESKFDAQIKKHKIRTRDVNVVITGAEIVYKLLELPELPEKEVASAIHYKLKATLPLSFKDIVMDYYKIEKIKRPGGHLYFVAAVPKEKILEAIEGIKAAGLSLKDIVAPSCALRNALVLSAPESCAVIYLGRYSSLIVLIKEGQVVFAREVKVGGEDITQAMVGVVQTEQARLELDYKQAEEIKDKYGVPLDLEQYTAEAGVPAAELLEMMRPALEKISTEILNTFDYYRKEIGDETEFKKVYFTGGASQTKNLLAYFQQQLGLGIEPLPLNVIKSHQLTLALGAVIPGKDCLSLIPRKSEELLLGSLGAAAIKELRKWLKSIFMGILYLLILTLVFGWYYRQQRDLEVAHRTLQKEYQQQMAKLGKEAEETKGITELLKYSLRDRFTLVMHELNEIVPSDVYFSSLKYSNDRSELKIIGIIVEDGGKRSMAKFIEKLNQSRYFKSADLVYLEESDQYNVPTYNFELNCLLPGESKK